MKEHGLEPLQFELKGDFLKVTLPDPGERFMELGVVVEMEKKKQRSVIKSCKHYVSRPVSMAIARETTVCSSLP